MKIIKLILLIALLNNVNLSINLEDLDIFDLDDYKMCTENDNIIGECSSINSNLKLKEDKCCDFTAYIDPLKVLKNRYHEDWKKKASQKYGFDENLSEEEIREKYVKIEKQTVCNLFTREEEYQDLILYEISKLSYDDKVYYDCGDGEKSYKTKEFIPKLQKYKILKDYFEGIMQFNEENCLNSASKFLTDDVLICWNKINFYDIGYDSIGLELC